MKFIRTIVLFDRWVLQAMKLGLEHLKADVEDAVVRNHSDKHSLFENSFQYRH